MKTYFDISTTYMGLELRSPIVVSACPLSEHIDNILRMEDAGAGAVVLFSLFEEQIQRESKLYEDTLAATTNIFPEATTYFPDLEEYRMGATQYLELIRQAKEKVDIPIIGSLNAVSESGWISYARDIEAAGADGLEVNVYYIPADISLAGEEVEQRYLDIISAVKEGVNIPVAVKLNPYFSSMANMALRLSQAGADGLVLFNRFYQPDFDIDRMELLSNLAWSHPQEIRLPLLWLAVLHGRVPCSLAASTGVDGAEEVIKYLLAGADVVMTASALFKHGIEHIATMQAGLEEWMQNMGLTTLSVFKGAMSQKHVADPSAYERANYIRILGNA